MDRCGVTFVFSLTSLLILSALDYTKHIILQFFLHKYTIDIVFNSLMEINRIDVLYLFELLIIDRH